MLREPNPDAYEVDEALMDIEDSTEEYELRARAERQADQLCGLRLKVSAWNVAAAVEFAAIVALAGAHVWRWM